MGNRSMPFPFIELSQVETPGAAAISTGYLFASDQLPNNVYSKWMPGPNPAGYNGLLPLEFEPNLWFRIYPGPRSVPLNERESRMDGMTGTGVNALIVPPVATGRTPNEGYRYLEILLSIPDILIH